MTRALVEPLSDRRDDGGAVEDPALGAMPVWRFEGLYPEPAEAAIDADLATADAACRAFAARYEGRLAELDAAGLLGAIRAYEAIDDRIGRALSYLSLRSAQNTLDTARAKALGDARVRATDLSAPLVFFTLELNRLPDDRLEAMLAENADLAAYRAWIDAERAFRSHQLSDELERFLHDKSAAGAGAWVRLFDETVAGLEFEVSDGAETRKLALEPTLTLLTHRDRGRRAAAAAALSSVFAANAKLFTLITNTLAKEKEIEDRWRRYPAPQSARHLANRIEPEVVTALRDAVVAAYPRLSHRYYAMKARWLGVEKLEHWDRNAPLPSVDDRVVPFDEARATVLDAFGAFSPNLAEIAERFFARGWIDAPATPGKAPGAFAHPTVASAHPFVLLNYLGKTRDVMTLAHELGHGVHQVLAAGRGELMSRTPLTLAETASVFGEMLTFRRLIDRETDPARRKALLAGKVEDMINTVVRQIAFYDFESRLHLERRKGELTPEDIGRIWSSVQSESLGPAFRLAEGYENYWIYISHFIHSPFYVYAYAFGDGLVNALYAEYRAGAPGFEERYLDLLRAGGSKHHRALLAPFGLDATDPAFWDRGLSVIGGMIDELEALDRA